MPGFASERKSKSCFAIAFTSLLGSFLVTKCLAKAILREGSSSLPKSSANHSEEERAEMHTSVTAIEWGGTLFPWCREESEKADKARRRHIPENTYTWWLPSPGPALQMLFRTENRSISLEFKPWVLGGNFRFKPKQVRIKHSEENDIYNLWFQQIVSFLFK